MNPRNLNQDLRKAISDSDLLMVQTILEHKDPNGIPFADINYCESIQPNILLYALNRSPPNVDICLALLDVRDNDNNPVIDINTKSACGNTALFWALYNIKDSLGRRSLVNRMLNLRSSSGEAIWNFQSQATSNNFLGTLLTVAIDKHDIETVEIILDHRNANGTYAIDINEINRWNKQTALDVVTSRIEWFKSKYQNNPTYDYYIWIKHLLLEQGALTSDQLKGMSKEAIAAVAAQCNRIFEKRAFVQPRILRPSGHYPTTQKAVRAPASAREEKTQREIKLFIANSQGTHDPNVETSVANSLARLKKRYPKVNEAKNLREIEQFLNSLSYHHKKKSIALRSFERLKSLLPDDLALVWEGIMDKKAPPLGAKQVTDSILHNRLEALVDQLYDIHTEYNGKDPSCTGGSRNQLVKTLDKAHPDVEIVYTTTGISLAAAEYAEAMLKVALLEKTAIEQREIIKTWKHIDNQDEEKAPAVIFHRDMKNKIETALRNFYGTLLTPGMLKNIMDDYNLISTPNIHPLLTILSTINDIDYKLEQRIEDPKDKIVRLATELQRKLQSLWSKVHEQKVDQATEKKLEKNQQTMSEARKQLSKITRPAQAKEWIDSIEDGLKSLATLFRDHKEIAAFRAEVAVILSQVRNSLSPEKKSVEKNNYSLVAKIKEKVAKVFDEKRTLDADYEWLNLYYIRFNKLDALLKDIHKLAETIDPAIDQRRQQLITNMRQNTIDAFESQDFDSLYNKMSAQIRRIKYTDQWIQAKLLDKSCPNAIKMFVINRCYSADYSQKDIEKAYHSTMPYYQAINLLNTHADRFDEKINDQKQAKDTAKKLCHELKTQFETYLASDHKAETTQAFVQAQNTAINTAEPILAHHRGWKGILGNFAVALIPLVGLVALGLKAAHSYATKGRVSLFFKTDSEQKLGEIENRLMGMRAL